MSVPEVVAQAFLVLMTKGRAGTLDKSEALELKVIDSMSNILGWNDKEKKVIHTLDIPKINAKDI
jgi:hypothetical protein